MRTVSETEMRLAKIWLSHVGGVAVLRFLSTFDRRGTNAGLDLQSSEETDWRQPHILLPDLRLTCAASYGEQIKAQLSSVRGSTFVFLFILHATTQYFTRGTNVALLVSQTRNQLSAWTCDKQQTYCTACTKCQGLAILKIKKKKTTDKKKQLYMRTADARVQQGNFLCTLQAVPSTAQGQGCFFHQHSAFMCFYLTALF